MLVRKRGDDHPESFVRWPRRERFAGLKWMWRPESPFYMKPRLDRRLMEWAWRFRQAATAGT